MILVESGQVRLNDTVASFIPEFGKYGKDRITVRDLLTHTSGLRPDLDLADSWVGRDTAMALAAEEVLSPAPHRFVYRDINFELLGEIVARVSKTPLETFVHDRVFGPLGMKDTTFKPAVALRPRIAPTETCRANQAPCDVTGAAGAGVGVALRGVVHDPTARRMGGVAGHAGLFSTAADLAIFCRMLLDGGASGSTRILAPLTVSRMTSPAGPAGDRSPRPGLGLRLVVLGEPRRTAAARLVWSHRVHGHVALDRSGDAAVRGVPVESRAPGRQRRRHAVARARGHARGVGRDRRDAIAGPAARLVADAARPRGRRGRRAGPAG
jgi:CubicO group peptidase (beta-lactamase class C family)